MVDHMSAQHDGGGQELEEQETETCQRDPEEGFYQPCDKNSRVPADTLSQAPSWQFPGMWECYWAHQQ
ncbi:hypothetical protein Nmel_007460, partial [Mimus melanotis]